MDRNPYQLAALASIAVPGLDPVGVEFVPSEPEHEFDLAVVTDVQDRRWVVRCPRTPAAAARQEQTIRLLTILGRRVPFGVPAPRGFAGLAEGGRACVYPYLAGQTVDFAGLPPGRGVAAELGRAIAALHNVERGLFEEAGVPGYDADAYRARRIADLDRAAATGRVPTTLLTRWEAALEDVALWRFAPTPVHGDLTGDQVLVTFTDPSDASTGQVKGLVGWEDAKIADPADDFAALVAEADPDAVETVLEAYAHARVERPDPNLLIRARLASELALLGELMRAVTGGLEDAADAHAAALRHLDEDVHALSSPDDYRRTSLEPVTPRRVVPPPAVVDDDGEDDLPELDTSVTTQPIEMAGSARPDGDPIGDSAPIDDRDEGPAMDAEDPEDPRSA